MTSSSETSTREIRWAAWLEWLLIVVVFALAAGSRPPDVNEPHYLAKCRHFWDQTWISEDFFLDSADTHLVFYVTVGWLTRLAPLVVVAWIGRAVTLMLLAAGWVALCRTLIPKPFFRVLAAGAFLALQSRFHMAGEWVVGGLEAKGFAYAFVFLGMAAVIEQRYRAAALWLGLATCFHVLVGGWTVVAVGLATLVSPEDRRLALASWPAWLGGLALALVGIVPAIWMSAGADTETASRAHEIYVFERLRHHLVPAELPRWFPIRFLIMIAAWVAMSALDRSPGMARLRRIVAGGLAISVVGATLAWLLRDDPRRAAAILRFYWFRIADTLVPLGLAIELGAVLCRPPKAGVEVFHKLGRAAMLLGVVAHLASSATEYRLVPRADKSARVVNAEDWKAACGWAAQNTPGDARFITPRLSQTFKWHAGRSEVGTWKDIPQDAKSIVEWWQRMLDQHALAVESGEVYWRTSLSEAEPELLLQLGKKYSAGYLLTEAEPSVALPQVYRNASYAIYELR